MDLPERIAVDFLVSAVLLFIEEFASVRVELFKTARLPELEFVLLPGLLPTVCRLDVLLLFSDLITPVSVLRWAVLL